MQSWQNSLSQTLSRLRKNEQTPRVALVGIGHELRGDDAAGVMLARAFSHLLEREGAGVREKVLVIDAGPAPENHTGALRRFMPDLVLLVDAAELCALAGTVRWLAWQETSGLSASTHSLPLYMLAQYLSVELKCEVALLGIQPAVLTLGAALSPAVQRAVEEIVQALRENLNGNTNVHVCQA
jgi:hydrogenase maturation protease HycI